MTPNAASPAAAAVVALALLGSLSPTTSFVPAASRGQASRHADTRPSSRFFGPLRMSTSPRGRRQRQPPSCLAPTAATGHQRQQQQQQQQRASPPYRRVLEAIPSISSAAAYTSPRLLAVQPLSIGGAGFDDIDPLEEGPDPDAILLQGEPEMLRQQQEEEDYEAELAEAAAALASAKKAPTKKQIAEEAVAAAVAQMGDGDRGEPGDAIMASLDPKKRKSNRVRIDPLMPKGAVAPNEWAEMENLEEGCRGVLVVCHSGLPRDKQRATALIRAVKDRYGHLIHTYEWWDEDPELTEDDREDIGTFEVWLEGPTVVHYHERAEGKVDMDDEQMQKILDDLERRVVDEAILGQYVNQDVQFVMPGFRISDHKRKQYPVL